jgi:hypothetical protein
MRFYLLFCVGVKGGLSRYGIESVWERDAKENIYT